MTVRSTLRLLLLTAVALLAVAAPAPAAIFNSVAAGTDSTCAIRPGGSLWCWGEGRAGQVGVIGASRARTPLAVIGTYTATQVAVGQAYFCVRLVDATAACSGSGSYGQIGNGQVSNQQFPQEVGLPNVATIAAGNATVCAVSNGAVWCWGDGARGQLGDGQLRVTPTPTPTQVAGLTGIVGVAVGTMHVCALRADGQVACWGDAADGKLGYATDRPITFPGPLVQGLSSVSSVAAGRNHTCALRSDGSVWCWGRNEFGQLGNGARQGSATPVQVSGLANAISVGVGLVHACAVRQDLRTFCWGSNQYAQLGDGAVTGARAYDSTPQLVDDSPRGTAVFVPTPLNETPRTTRGGRLELRLLRVSKVSRRARCPARADVTVRSKGRETTRRTTDVEPVAGGCAVTIRVLLPDRTARATSAVYVVRGKGLRTVKRRAVPRAI